MSMATKSVIAPATMRLQATATVSVYDWNRELLHWCRAQGREELNPDLLSMWANIRSDSKLLETFIDTAFYKDLQSEECSWPDPITVTAGTVGMEYLCAALGTVGLDLNDWLWPLSECMRVRYDEATLESPFSAPQRISLADMDVDDFRAGLPIAGTCVARRTANFMVDMTLTVGQDPHWDRLFLMPQGTTHERLLRVWREVQQHPEIFNALRLNTAIGDVYDSYGLDAGYFSQIMKRFAGSHRDGHEEYEQFKPVLEKLPPEDQQWLAEVNAGKHGDGFGAIVGFVLQFMNVSDSGTNLSISNGRNEASV
jgi:hypothetical protein